MNESGGVSEWFYTNEKTLDDAFEKVNDKYGGKLYSTHLKKINANARQNQLNYTDKLFRISC